MYSRIKQNKSDLITKNSMKNIKKLKSAIKISVYFLLIPALIIVGTALFNNKQYVLVAAGIAALSFIPVFLSFEKGRHNERELLVIACMTVLSVLSREIFMLVPHFKPVTAMIIITAIAFGKEAGFLTGALTALLSNIFFGQGPWTPFQMCAWGLTGLISGLIFGNGKTNLFKLILTGIVSGIGFSFFMDIYTALSLGSFSFSVYLAALLSAAPVTAIYCFSNVVFLLLLSKPLLKILTRIKTKYGVFQKDQSRKIDSANNNPKYSDVSGETADITEEISQIAHYDEDGENVSGETAEVTEEAESKTRLSESDDEGFREKKQAERDKEDVVRKDG